MNLALFDFDGTISHDDTFTPFIKSALPLKRRCVWGLWLAPAILGYHLGWVSASTMRQKLVKAAFKGVSKADVIALGHQYAVDYLPKQVRQQAIERLHWHLSNGDKVIVVSASLSVYLKPWCEAFSADFYRQYPECKYDKSSVLLDNNHIELICPELADEHGRLTGLYKRRDCTGAEKAQRVKEQVKLSDFARIYAYGDTQEDNELLALAHEAHYQWKSQSQ
ncbi:HAD-IB family phosphatase [uncultured Shewanella sp.]|uniref:HAD-IB family phosphatase n=1 Tax=uncultured Shewanella sp. TaxID=173975 RepID=UPI00260999AE|nr:HAD-IB family phosphatase [uncultured Shewanella sp.]